MKEYVIDDYYENNLLDEFPTKNENSRSRAERRKLNAKKARRKQRITKDVYRHPKEDDWDYYDNLHQYSKNKIHCSCPICSDKINDKKFKTKDYGHRGKNEWDTWKKPPISKKVNGKVHVIKEGEPTPVFSGQYGTTYHRRKKNYKPSEIRKIEAMDIYDY